MDIKVNIDEDGIVQHMQKNADKLVKEYLISYGGENFLRVKIKEAVDREIDQAIKEVLLEKEALKNAVRTELKLRMKRELTIALNKVNLIESE